MVAAVPAAGQPQPLARGLRELGEHGRGDSLLTRAFEHRGSAVGINAGLIADGLEAGNAVFKVRVVEVRNAALDGVVKALEAQVGLGRALVQICDVGMATLGALLPPVENGRQHFLKPGRVE